MSCSSRVWIPDGRLRGFGSSTPPARRPGPCDLRATKTTTSQLVTTLLLLLQLRNVAASQIRIQLVTTLLLLLQLRNVAASQTKSQLVTTLLLVVVAVVATTQCCSFTNKESIGYNAVTGFATANILLAVQWLLRLFPTQVNR